jgi:hypothetical protein
MSRVISSLPSLVSRATHFELLDMHRGVDVVFGTMRSERRIESSKL